MWQLAATALLLNTLVATPALAAATPALDADINAAMAMLNDIRAREGLGPVTIDKDLSLATQAHAAYLVANVGKPQLEGLNAHDEDLSLPGATKAGRDAGLASDIARGTLSVVDSMIGLLAAPLHQRWLLEPGLKRVGIGVAAYSFGGLAVVIDVGHGLVGPQYIAKPIVYPAPDQAGVPTRFYQETPDPRLATPAIAGAVTGPAITVNPTCGNLLPPSRVVVRTQDGRDVPAWTVNPGAKLSAVGGERTVEQIIILPQRELEPGTSYQVEVDAACVGPRSTTQNGLAWSFTTGGTPLRPRPQPVAETQKPPQPAETQKPPQGTPANPGMDPSLLRATFRLDYVSGELADYVGGPFFASMYLANNGLSEGWGDPAPVVAENGAWVLRFSSGVVLRARPGEPVSVSRPLAAEPAAQDQAPAVAEDNG
jgi:hypothetical protein